MTVIVSDLQPGRCGPCSLEAHGDCRRYEGERCGCPETDACGAALKVFYAAEIGGPAPPVVVDVPVAFEPPPVVPEKPEVPEKPDLTPKRKSNPKKESS